MAGNLPSPMTAEFDTVTEWTAQVATDLGRGYFRPAACRGSGHPSSLDWLLTGVRPVPVEPEPGACRAARRLFRAVVVEAGAAALPVADAAADAAWCLGVLCTAPGEAAQLAMLRELRRVVRPPGRIGLLAFLAAREHLDDPPQGNHFPTSPRLDALVSQAGLEVTGRASPDDLAPPSRDWADATAAVERELQRRFRHTGQLAMADAQSARIGRLLDSGELVPQLLRLRSR